MAQKRNGDAAAKLTARRRKALNYRGVRIMPWGKFAAEIRQPGTKKNVWLGTFEEPQKAAIAYDAAARLFYRSKAKTNFPPVIEDDIENAKYFLEKLDESSAISSSSGGGAGSKRKRCLETVDFLGIWGGVQPPSNATSQPLDLELRLAPPGTMWLNMYP